MPHFRQLDYTERKCIAAFWMQGYSMAEIARRMCRSRSTIKRELERNGTRDQEGQLVYHHDSATLRYWFRQEKVRYGRGYRRYFGRDAFMNSFDDRQSKPSVLLWKGRYRPDLLFAFRDRRCTKQQDKSRFFRESEYRETRKHYEYLQWPLANWSLPNWLLPKRKQRMSTYIPGFSFPSCKKRPSKRRTNDCKNYHFYCRWWRYTRKQRKYRLRQNSGLVYWPVGFSGNVSVPKPKTIPLSHFSDKLRTIACTRLARLSRMAKLCLRFRYTIVYLKNEQLFSGRHTCS